MYVEASSLTASHSVHGNNATVMDAMLDHVQKQDWLSHIFYYTFTVNCLIPLV